MKKLLTLIILISFSVKTKAQVVFCPPGAQWNYLFSGTIFSPGNTYNEPVIYIGDSIQGTDTLKKLLHNRSSLFCGVPNDLTLINQKGDTIFFKNKITQNTWQILYNFAAQVGQTWQTTVLSIGSQSKVFTTTVQAIGSISINGFTLKTLSVNTTSFSGLQTITERFGSQSFLFNFAIKSPSSCDGNVFLEYLCYQDATFGLEQFGDKSCNYYTVNGVGLEKNGFANPIVKIFPNPVSDYLIAEMGGVDAKNFEVCVLDLQGRELKSLSIKENEKIDLSDLSKGLYLITLTKGKEVIYKEKLVKE